jgi:TolB-like protein/Tfp pilus assembly protein PilF
MLFASGPEYCTISPEAARLDSNNFFSELKRRNVYKVAVGYAVVGWLVMQVAGTVVPALHLPDGITSAVVVMTLLGFPIALVIAWAFEMTPEGMKRTENVSPEQPIPQRSRRKFTLFVVALGSLAAALLAYQLWRGKSSIRLTSIAPPGTPAAEIIPKKSIAVLPFDSLSEDKTNAYFAEGIQDEILTRLAGIADLKVISRTSTERYKSKPEDLRTVSNELRVAHVLEGSVQRVAGKVRVNVQLIDARADAHLWAKSYDGDVKDVFAVESEVSQEVADALKARLSPSESSNLTSAPTHDPEAYDFFLKGEFEEKEAESSVKPDVFDQAADWYRQALARDPRFALALARLVNNRMQRHWFCEALSEPELEKVKKDAEDAVAMAPGLSEAHNSLGIVYYFGHRQYAEALTEFRKATELQPNNILALQYEGYVHRRLGEWRQCLAELTRSQEQNPRDAVLAANLARTYAQLRMWKEAESEGKRSLSINPHNVDAMFALLISKLNRDGDLPGTQRVLDTFPADANLVTDAGHAMAEGLIGGRAYFAVMNKNFAGALACFDKGKNKISEAARLSARAAIHVFAGDAAGATAEIEQARSLAEERARTRPSELDALVQLSWTNLALNRASEAVTVAQKAAELLPPEKDALVGSFTLFNLAAIDAHTGHAGDAITILKRLLSTPSGQTASLARLRIDPVWDPIRSHPGFQELLTSVELIGPDK